MSELSITLLALAVAFALLLLSLWRSSRPRRDTVRVRWIPWRYIMLFSGAAIFLAGVHAMSLAGLHVEGGRLGLR
ncbi:MAG: hypothetical protein R3C52_11510 [Hyphomonadaceae bacterium]